MKNEDAEIESYHRAMAEKAVKNQQVAQAGAEMENWVLAGNLAFIKDRVLAPLRSEYIEAIESAKWVASTVNQVANIQGTLMAMSVIEARINSIVQGGKNALSELKDLQDSTLQSEGE